MIRNESGHLQIVERVSIHKNWFKLVDDLSHERKAFNACLKYYIYNRICPINIYIYNNGFI